MLWAENNPDSPFNAGVIALKNMSRGIVFLGFGTGRTKRIELVTEDLENFEKELEKLAIEIYTPEIAFTETI